MKDDFARQGVDLEALLDYIQHSRNFDVRAYKRPTLARRIHKRLQTIGTGDYGRYIEVLASDPDEFAHLLDALLINVTGFFRDPPAWQYLDAEIIPRLVAAKSAGDPIRVWSAGCSSGQEVYSLCMLLIERLGESQFRERAKIYATDVDDGALAEARQASYTATDVKAVPPDLAEKYFERVGDRYLFRPELRRLVIFGHNHLVQDAPISRIDLLACRNTLMYLTPQTQARVLSRLHFALNDGGYLFLGKAEMLLNFGDLFTAVDLRRRIFARVPGTGRPERPLMTAPLGIGRIASLGSVARLMDAAFEGGRLAQVVSDPAGRLVLANERARAWFGLTTRDLGRPVQEIASFQRPVSLSAIVEQAQRQRHPIVSEVVGPPDADRPRTLKIEAESLIDRTGAALGVSVTLADVSDQRQLEAELQSAHQELQTAFEELQATNEEMETTNEELQSTIEELETTNEELQASNEEMETINEELQSTNEELNAVNQQARQRTQEVDELNAFLGAILTSVRSGVAVTDQDLHIQTWNRMAEELWGLRAGEVLGKNLLNLDIGLPLEQLRQPIRACLSGEDAADEVVLDAVSRRGKPLRCRVTCSKLLGKGGEALGLIVLMDDIT